MSGYKEEPDPANLVLSVGGAVPPIVVIVGRLAIFFPLSALSPLMIALLHLPDRAANGGRQMGQRRFSRFSFFSHHPSLRSNCFQLITGT